MCGIKSFKSCLFFLVACMPLMESCNQPKCENKNHVFEQYDPHTPEYKAEVAGLLKTLGTNAFRYWVLDTGIETGTECLSLSMQGKQCCATLQVQVTGKLTKLCKGGYRGAELKDIAIMQQYINGELIFILENAKRIID